MTQFPRRNLVLKSQCELMLKGSTGLKMDRKGLKCLIKKKKKIELWNICTYIRKVKDLSRFLNISEFLYLFII